MSTYYVRQKFFKLREDYFIENEKGENVYSVKSNFEVVRKKIALCDLSGNEIYFFKEKIFKIRPRFYIFDNEASSENKENRLGVINKKGFFLPTYKLKINGEKYVIRGFMGFPFKYTVHKNKEIIAKIKKQVLNIRDVYAVECLKESESAVCVAIALMIDILRSQDMLKLFR